MGKQQRRGASKLIAGVREAVDRLAEALDTAVRGQAVTPAVVPVRQPTAEDLRRYAHRRRRQ